MKRFLVLTSSALVALTVAGAALAHGPQGGGPGWGMGPGMVLGWGGGPGTGMGPGMMRGWRQAEPLTTESVTQRLQNHLAMMGNDRLLLGSVTEQEGAIVAEIVTQGGALVDKLSFDKETGQAQRID